jgi:L-asparagine oxygenase
MTPSTHSRRGSQPCGPAGRPRADRCSPRDLEITDANGRTWSVAEPQEGVFELDPRAAEQLAGVSRRVTARHSGRPIDDHDLLIEIEVAMRRATSDLVGELVRFRLAGSRDGILLLRGLPLGGPLPATPRGGAFPGAWSELGVASVTQLMIMSVLGDVISYADEKEGRLIQDICPVPGAEGRQENTGSCLLELHTEDGFHPNKPHFLSLLCLRSDHHGEAMTVAGGMRAVLPLLSPEHARVLREPWFRVRMASSFVGTGPAAYSEPMPVLSGRHDDPDLCVDFHATEPMTELAHAAVEELRGHLLDSLVGTVLEPGDMLIVDNRKAVHGRTDFSPRYDGEDRWLRRCFAVTDIRASQELLYPASRMHEPLRLAV